MHEQLIKELAKYTYWCSSSTNISHDIHPEICDRAVEAIKSLQTELYHYKRISESADKELIEKREAP